MPTITMRLSQDLFDKLGAKMRRQIGDQLRERLSVAGGVEIGEIATYWYPWQDAQNPNDLEAEVLHRVAADKLPSLTEPLLGYLCTSRGFRTGLKVGVWFPLCAGKNTYVGGTTKKPPKAGKKPKKT